MGQVIRDKFRSKLLLMIFTRILLLISTIIYLFVIQTKCRPYLNKEKLDFFKIGETETGSCRRGFP